MSLRMRFRSKLRGLIVGAVLFPASFTAAQEEYIVVDLGPVAGVVAPLDLQGVHLNNITELGRDPAFILPAVQTVTIIDNQGLFSAVRMIEGGQTTPLGTLGGTETVVHDVNFYPLNPANNVRIVGASQIVDSFFRAFIWDEVLGPTDLGTLGGDESSAMALNDTRQIVGWAQDALGEAHATLWEGIVTPCDLNALVGKLGPSLANDIDNYGHIVGQSEYTGKAQATAWVRDIAGVVAPLDLGALTGDLSEALAVEAGRTADGVLPTQMIVAGWFEVTPGGARHAADWDVDTITGFIGPMDLGTLGGTNSVALDLTTAMPVPIPIRIVGWSDIPPPIPSRHAARIRSRAKSATGGVALTHAFIYDATNGMRDLNDLIDPLSGWELTRADSLNSSGMITGIGQLNGIWHAYRLDPINPPQACPADTNNSGSVNVTDLLQLLAAWGPCP